MAAVVNVMVVKTIEKQTSLSNVALSAIGKAVSPPAATSFKKYRIVTYLIKSTI